MRFKTEKRKHTLFNKHHTSRKVRIKYHRKEAKAYKSTKKLEKKGQKAESLCISMDDAGGTQDWASMASVPGVALPLMSDGLISHNPQDCLYSRLAAQAKLYHGYMLLLVWARDYLSP